MADVGEVLFPSGGHIDEQLLIVLVIAVAGERSSRPLVLLTLVPQDGADDVSLVCTDPDRNFDWCEPQIAHIGWDVSQVARSVSRWASKVARGKDDRLQTLITAAFVEGGSIGPVKKGRQ